MYQVEIHHNNKIYIPIVKDGVTWQTERSGSASTFKFTVYQDGKLKYTEGDLVKFYRDDKGIFFGFIFTISRDKVNSSISFTCYDQLRYLKNKDTYSYVNKTTGEFVKMIASDYKLRVGKICDTGYKLSRIEDNQSLFDMILNSISETVKAQKKLFVLYDDFGKLRLQNAEDMVLNLLIDSDTSGSSEYKTSIDDGTYNRIKLYYQNEETGKRDTYIAQDSDTIQQWGVLQYYEEISDPSIAVSKVNSLLALYNSTTKELKVKNCFGNIKARAGFSIKANLVVDNVQFMGTMLIEKASHTFKEDEYLMDLTLRGVDFGG